MEQFKEYKLRCCKTCATDVYIRMCYVCPAMREREIGWNAALRAQAQPTPAEDRYGREPENTCNCETCVKSRVPKPLAQYLGEYIEYEMIDNADCDTWVALLEQALDAYELTENVKIRIERV